MKLGKMPTEFFAIVRALRRLPPRYRQMALYAADWWTAEQLETKEANDEFLSRSDEVSLLQ